MQKNAAIADLIEMGKALIADYQNNNHFTSHPQFTVQKRRRVYGFDTDYADVTVWIDRDENCCEVSKSRSRVLESRYERGDTIPDNYIRTGYQDEWVFVDVFVTYESAKVCVDELNRRYGEDTHRTYVESGYRNKEWQKLRAALMSLAEEA